jgi:ribosomal protein S18 acetylase RimI-like enzyme
VTHRTVRLLGARDAALVEAASDLFDHPIIPDQLQGFLASERDFLWFAFDGEAAIGFASATSILHPDSQPVLFLNEIGVADKAQRSGVGRSLMQAVLAFAQSRGWQSTWVLAELGDDRAQGFYRALHPQTEMPAVMFEWEAD